MDAIVSTDKNWGIGYKNQLLAHIPGDMEFFRSLTTGNVVVMGRKTWESLPDGALPGRVNIVLTQNGEYQAPGAVVVHSIEELHKELTQYDTKQVFVIGGESVYRQLLDECTMVHVTKIAHAYDADAYFPNLDELAQWELAAAGADREYEGVRYSFQLFQKVPKTK